MTTFTRFPNKMFVFSGNLQLFKGRWTINYSELSDDHRLLSDMLTKKLPRIVTKAIMVDIELESYESSSIMVFSVGSIYRYKSTAISNGMLTVARLFAPLRILLGSANLTIS